MNVNLSDPEPSARMDETSGLICQKLETMIEAADPPTIQSRGVAITAFFPWAVCQERNGRGEPLGTFLRVAKASRADQFMQHLVEPFVATLLDEESPVCMKRAAILASSYIPWMHLTNDKRLVQLWAAAAWVVPYTDKIGRIVADTLLQMAFHDSLRPHIPTGMWSWLDKRPSLPPDCERRWGSARDVVQTVRALRNVGTLTSYLLLVWSEWDYVLYSLEEMCASIREDVCGIWMGRHREDLLRRLDHILGQLDLGLETLRRHKPDLNEDDVERMKAEYGQLREVLLEVDGEATDMLIGEYLGLGILFGLLTPADRRRIPLDVYVCDPASVSVVACPTVSRSSGSTTQLAKNPRPLPIVLRLALCCRFDGRCGRLLRP